MRCHVEMFGGYHVAIYGGGVSVAITAPDGTSVHLQGEESAMLVDDYNDACEDMAKGPGTRWGRMSERDVASEIFGVLF